MSTDLYTDQCERENVDLAFPITFEAEDLDGHWILFSATKYLGKNKWAGFDEDGTRCICDSSQLKNPRI